MRLDGQDWIDRVIARDGTWEPPAHFVDRVAMQAFQELPQRKPALAPASGLGWLRMLLTGLREDVALRIQGYRWVFRQYRDLLVRGI